MVTRKIILKRKTNDSESDKYQYFISCINGVELVTPFKDKATVLNEGEEIKVLSNDWRPVLVRNKK